MRLHALLLALLCLCLASCGQDEARMLEPQQDYLYNVWVHTDGPVFWQEWYCTLTWYSGKTVLYTYTIRPLPQGAVSTTFPAPVDPHANQSDWTRIVVYARNGAVLLDDAVDWQWMDYLWYGNIAVPFTADCADSTTGLSKGE